MKKFFINILHKFLCIDSNIIEPDIAETLLLRTDIQKYIEDLDKQIDDISVSYSTIDDSECVVCLESDCKFIPFECLHKICSECYNKLPITCKKKCCVCQHDNPVIALQKNYLIIFWLKEFDIGIYFKPSVMTTSGKIIDYDVIEDFNKSDKIPAIKNFINKYNYHIIFDTEMTKDIFVTKIDLSNIKFHIVKN